MSQHVRPSARTSRHPSQSTVKSRKIEAAVEFAVRLREILRSATTAPDGPDAVLVADAPSLARDAADHAAQLHVCQQTCVPPPAAAGDPELDELATGLWNACTRLRRALRDGNGGDDGGGGGGGGGGGDDAPARAAGSVEGGVGRLARLCLCGRVLAFQLLGIARPREKGRAPVVVRLMRLGLKVLRDCVDARELKLAGQVVQATADYKEWLQDMSRNLPDDEVRECQCLEVEYFIMRTAMCWVENRLDVAEHMYSKAERLRPFLTPDYAERLADVLYEIGKSLADRGDFAISVKWFERAIDAINSQELEHLSREGLELRLAIFQALVTSLLGANTTEGFEKAENYVNLIEAEAGNNFVVSLLKLELLQKSPAEVFDSEAYGDVLRRIIRNFVFSESAFKLVMHHIRKLHDKSPGSGCAALDDFVMTLSNGEKDEWLEKAVVTRMWMITNQRDSVETVNAVQNVLGCLSKPLGPEAAAAAQALLWKKLESNYSQGNYDLAESWCHLSLHDSFRNCGTANRSKLERKLLLCALARNSFDAATSIIHGMSPQSRKEPMTAYLSFKVAVRIEDRALAESCLETVAQAPDHVDYLGACIAESQKAGDVVCAIAALRKLQEKYEYTEPSPVHLPALFRCTIRLLNLLAERPGVDGDGIVGDLCESFESVVSALEQRNKSSSAGHKLFTVDELEWFSRNAYNLALKNTASWELRSVVRMLTACVNIISYFPPDMGSKVELALKLLFSHFVISSALIALARTEDNLEKQRQDYATMRKHVGAFDCELPEHLSQLDEECRDDMLRKHAALLAFDFEAAVALGQWDDLGSIVQRAVPCKSVTALQAMADCLLRAKAPGQALYSTMRKIVKEIWALERFDAAKLAKYTRCLFQATLPLDDGLAMNLLDEACSKAKELRESKAGGNWPEEEVEWMATTSFNHAIDCYSAHQAGRAKEWATKAINLAHYCGDGRLEEILQNKYLRLNLDGDMR
ncbi:hypothetical protein VTH06DRAFT_1830 [Thermothelomyces fergusii]